MIFYNNEARANSRKSIAEMHAKIANMPLSAFPDGLADVQTLHFLLDTLDNAIKREIKKEANA